MSRPPSPSGRGGDGVGFLITDITRLMRRRFAEELKAGRVRQVAVTSAKRFPPLPDVPAVAEAGFPAFDISGWWGLLAPAALPREILSRVHAETLKAMEQRDTRDKLTAQGIVVITNTPEQFAAYIRSEIGNWSRIVAASGARID